MSLNFSTRLYRQLRCRIVDALADGTSPQLLIVLNHGFGASGDDLVDFGPMLIEASEKIAESCRFVFPAAPIDLGPMGLPGGRAWWPINMARLAEINQTRDFSQLTSLAPPGMKEAGEMLSETVRTALQDSGLTADKLVLGGFSQGAMVSTHVTLTEQLQSSLLVLFSGTLLNEAEWTRMAKSHPGCAVLQSHGRQDPLLPFESADRLREILSNAAFEVEFIEFDGPHTIPMNVLKRLQVRIEERL